MLHKLADAQTPRLEKLGADGDRYGQLVAFAFAGKVRKSLEQEFLQAGAARVAARGGNRSCALALLAAEAGPRQAARGL